MFRGAVIFGLVVVCIVRESSAGYGEGYQEEFNDGGTYTREGRGQFAEGYDTGLDVKNKVNQEAGHYGDVTADHAQYGDGEKSVHDSYHGQTGKTEESARNKAGHNKGFSTTGFQDFHHKDEVGKKTTFYDSSDNAGGSYDFKASEDVYGDKGERGVHKNGHNGKYKEMTRGSKGSYGHDDTLERKKYKNDMYERKGYSDNGYGNFGYAYHKGMKKPLVYPYMTRTPYPEEFYSEGYGRYPQTHLPYGHY